MDVNEIPKGVVLILICKDGRELAHAADFNRTCYGGFTLQESQKIRAKRALAVEVVRELSSPILSDAISRFDAEQILKNMCHGGCRIATVFVGCGDEDQ